MVVAADLPPRSGSNLTERDKRLAARQEERRYIMALQHR